MHSTITSKGQTTIPEKIRRALRIKPGDRLEYEFEGDRATIRVHPAVQLDALSRFKRSKAHFVDCLIAATAVAEDLPVAVFDHDFREFGDVRVETE